MRSTPGVILCGVLCQCAGRQVMVSSVHPLARFNATSSVASAPQAMNSVAGLGARSAAGPADAR